MSLLCALGPECARVHTARLGSAGREEQKPLSVRQKRRVLVASFTRPERRRGYGFATF